MCGLGLGLGFCLWVDFMFSLACKYFMGAVVAGANVMEQIFQFEEWSERRDPCKHIRHTNICIIWYLCNDITLHYAKWYQWEMHKLYMPV